VEDDPRRNSSLDMVNTAQICILTIKMTLQEAPMIGTCLTNIYTRKKETQKNLREIFYHRIKCTITTFLAAFMWKRPLNSAVLVTTTHRKPERVSDGMDTQVGAQMINNCKTKMTQRELYNVKDPP